MKNFRVNLFLRLILLALTIALFFYLFFQPGYIATVSVIGVIIIYQVYALLKFIDLTNKGITRFLQSIKHSDFSQTFTRQHGSSFNELNKSMNDVISEFQKTRSEKEEQYRFVQTVMQHIGVGLITYSQDGKIEFINNAAKKIFHVKQLFTLDNLESIQQGLGKAVRSIKPGEKATIKITGKNEMQQLVVNAAEFKIKEKNFILLSLQNILPELEETEMEAWQKLIRVLTHEIMNSVTPISSLAGTVNTILEKDELNNPETKDDIKLAIETIRKRSEGLIRFVDDYRSLSRIPEPDFEVFSIQELFNRVFKLMEPKLNEGNIRFSMEVNPETLDLTADTELIEQVLINLILNSIQSFIATANPEIKLSAKLDDWGKVSITVTDNGPGIPEDIQERIFIPFFSTRKNGSGIGLSLSRQIMRSHGGIIRVTSKPDSETSFILKF